MITSKNRSPEQPDLLGNNEYHIEERQSNSSELIHDTAKTLYDDFKAHKGATE